MRILLDQKLSPRLIRKLADVLPGLETVYDHDLIDSPDPFIFNWARRTGVLAVISTDRDFIRLAERFGPPHRVIRIDRCDFPSHMVEQLLRREAVRIHDFLKSDRAVFAVEPVRAIRDRIGRGSARITPS